MRYALSLVACAALAGAALAQCRTVGHQVVGQYSIQQSNVPYYQNYANYQLIYPAAVPVFLLPNQAYSIEPDLAAARIQQQIADDAAERAVAKMLQLLRQQQPGAAVPQANLTAPSNDHPSSLTTKVQATMNSHCVKCHKPGGSYEALDLRDVTKLSELQAARVAIRTNIDKGKKGFMPQGGEPVGAQAYADILDWSFEVSQKAAKAAPKAKAPDAKIPPAKSDDDDPLAIRNRRPKI